MSGGRPTKYTPEMGAAIIARMATGLSLTAAAAELNVHRSTLYDWEEAHPDFKYDCELARTKRQAFLERRLLSADTGPVVTSSIFALKNAAPDDWRDRVIQESTGPNGGPHVVRHVVGDPTRE